MPNDSGQTTSVWMLAPVPTFEPLCADTRADVCVIGTGISGLTTAYLLARSGKSVIVVDDGEIGSGETGRTTAHLTTALDDRYFKLEWLHGPEGARLAAESHAAAIDLVEDIVTKEGIACDFERLNGYLFAPSDEAADVLQREQVAARRAGLQDMELLPHAPVSAFGPGPCLLFPRQAQFHPMKYLAALASLITASGGRIFTGTHAQEIEGGAPGRVITSEGAVITADAIVVATNTPVNERLVIHLKQAPYRTYVIGVQIPRGSVPKGLYWDTADPYHYIRLTSMMDQDEELLLVGGEDHKTGQAYDTEERFTRLEAWTRDGFPMSTDVAFRWSGQVMEPVDGLAFIGPDPTSQRNVYIVTGDSGNGMTHGTIAGRLLTDLILGRDNPWATLYDPARINLRAAKEFIREGINVAAQYADWVTGGEVDSPDEIAPGSGAILRRGLTKIAVYRDQAKAIHEYKAECPHLGCVITWNATEHSWDCPCHGSRYDAYGRVVNGPANRNLEPIND